MTKTRILTLCKELDLGELRVLPEQVFGGLLHKMYKVTTDRGTYAIKALNPNIMKRNHVVDHIIFSEQVARAAYNNGISSIPAMTIDGRCLHEVEGEYYMVFEWVHAQSLLAEEVEHAHCEEIGHILAKLHNMDFSTIEHHEQSTPTYSTTDWSAYMVGKELMCHQVLLEVEDFLYKWDEQAHEAASTVCSHQITSHRDMDCKNVLWYSNKKPIIIDWESAGYVNPLQELVEVALAWSGAEILQFSESKFKVLIDAYLDNMGVIDDDILSVLNYIFKNKLDWLEYSIKRAQGIECSDKDEQELGIRGVMGTIEALKYYDNLIPICHKILLSRVSY